jgi:hypothetical protein
MMQARMRQMCRLTVVVVASVVFLAGAALAQSVGTWKLNLAKSKYNAGTPPKSSTLVYEAAGAGIKVTVDTVAADGTVTHYTYTANYDGKDNPVVGNPNADTMSRTRVNATMTTGVSKKGGKVTNSQTFVVSSDGKTLTITGKGTNAQGQKVDSVGVYDKQ